MNPYWDCNFFEFFGLLLKRAALFLVGQTSTLASDETQILVLSAVAISCGLIGPFLVLKRMSMLANSLSHTILLGISLAALAAGALWGGEWFDWKTLFFGSLFAAFLTALFTETLTRFFRLQEDASIGLVFTALFALGITIVSLYLRDVHLGIEAVMGNADALKISDIRFPALFIAINGSILFLFFKQFQLSSFDSDLAATVGLKVGFFRYLLLFLTAGTCIGAFRSVGVILVLAFLTGPYLTARLFSNKLSHLLFWTPLAGVAAACIGVALSRHLFSVYGLALSTGGLVATSIGLLYVIARTVAHVRKKAAGKPRIPFFTTESKR
ncbi:MAG: metal ABC transporter permease [Verrucomicrobia bacterium]|nr:metal ABC transporter permease [Verrucomicrobiota bacterium]